MLRWELHFELEDERKKWRLKRTWKKPVEEEIMMVDLSREDAPLE